ncbi:MAG: flippase-like domain-containing protein [Candidatus Zixiibacteriota bacterium]|nr:MAG: flippase-like domain-containing protein [candidate division Zixibacteria bacterium]
MTKRNKKIITQIAGLVISVGLLAFLFYKVDFAELAAALKGANYWWLIPNVVLIMVTMVFRAYRWRHMVRPIRDIGMSRLFSITMIGFMANNVLPFRLGEFVRAYSLSSKERVSKSAALATIFVERIVFDLLALLIIFGIVLLISPLIVFEELKIGAIITVCTGLLGLAFAIYLSSRSRRDSHILAKILGIFPRGIRPTIENTVSKFATGLEFLQNWRRIFWVTFHTFMIWVIMGLSNYFILLAFGWYDLPIAASFVILVVVSILIMVPASPGFIGVYHYGTVLSLAFYGIPREEALSCALVMHATQFLVVTLVGFYYLRREHLSLREIEEGAEQQIKNQVEQT